MTKASSDESLVAIVMDYCALQAKLVREFMRMHRPMDHQFFRDVPRKGSIGQAGERWEYVRHGRGVLFERAGIVVDVHRAVVDAPDGIDAWRLGQYLESTPSIARRLTSVADDALDGDLARLCERGALVSVDHAGAKLYRPNASSAGSSSDT